MKGRDLNREKARIRDNHTCQDCGKVWIEGQRRFDVHHLNGLCGKKSRGYDKSIEGLTTLCHKCHFNRPEHKQRGKEYIVKNRIIRIKSYSSIVKMRKRRYSLREIGKRYGVTKQRIHQILKLSTYID